MSGLGEAYKKNAPRKKGLSGRQAEWQGNYIKPKNITAVLAFYYLEEELSSLIPRRHSLQKIDILIRRSFGLVQSFPVESA